MGSKLTSQMYTSRLAHYHLLRRDDPANEQHKFYKYINENFHIIAAQRESLFEHALSWGLVHARTGKAGPQKHNAYSNQDKQDDKQFLKSPITIHKQAFIESLDSYVKYVKWSKLNFEVRDFFIYEQDMTNLEQFISKLHFMNKTSSFNEMFGMDWATWNKCHRYSSDILQLGTKPQLLLTDESVSKTSYDLLPVKEQEFLDRHSDKYASISKTIQDTVDSGFMPTGIPIKLQTLLEKKLMIKNFNECLMWYNDWADANDQLPITDTQQLVDQSRDELKQWYETDMTASQLFLE